MQLSLADKELSFEISGNYAGKYIGLNNISCKTNKNGTAIAELIDDTTLVINGRNERRYFCQEMSRMEEKAQGSSLIRKLKSGTRELIYQSFNGGKWVSFF